MNLEGTGVYAIVCIPNGKHYVGSAAKNFRIRFRQHKRLLNLGEHHARHLQHAWNKHGADAFKFVVLEECPREKCLEREQHYLDTEKPRFNVCPTAGSTLGRPVSDQTKAKIRDKAIGRKFTRSQEYRNAVSRRFKGRMPKPEHMAALQAGRKAQVFTPERLAKVSEALKRAYETGLRPREKTEQHRHRIGRAFAKFTDDQIREIRALRKQGATLGDLGLRFGACKSTMCQICLGNKYAWVT